MEPIVEREAVGGGTLTTDKNLYYQQNLEGRRIAIVVLGNSQRPLVHRYIDHVVSAVNEARPGSFAEVDIPLPPRAPFVRL